MNDVIMSLNKYSDMVFRLAFARTKNSHDAYDILQEVFLRYMKNNKDFNDEEHKKVWLIKTTINCSKTLLSSAWFRKTTALEDNIYEELKEKSEVYYEVLRLPKKYRTVLHLFYYEDMSIAEISALLNIKESTIKSQLHRARKQLKEILKENPVLLNTLMQNGTYSSSRMVGNKLYVISDYYIYQENIDKAKPETFVPSINNGEKEKCLKTNDIYVSPDLNESSYIVVTSLDIENPNEFKSQKAVLGSSSNIYMSLENLYVSSYCKDEEKDGYEYNRTNIIKFKLNEGNKDYLLYFQL